MEHLSRRDFIKVACYAVGGGSMLLLSPPSQAILPFIARFLVGKVAKGVARSATRRAATKSLRGAGRSAPNVAGRSLPRGGSASSTFRTAIDLGSIAVGIASLAPKVHADVKAYDCQAIWVNSGQGNDFVLQVANSTKERKHCQISYQVMDVKSGLIEMEEGLGTVSVEPSQDFVFPFEVSELPFKGVKQLHGVSDSNTLNIQPSANIMIASPEEIQFAE